LKRKPKPFSKNRPKPEEDSQGCDTAQEFNIMQENSGTGVCDVPYSVVQEPDRKFVPAFKFNGAKAGYVFTTGKQGLGYYEDLGHRLSNKSAGGGGSGLGTTAKTGVENGDQSLQHNGGGDGRGDQQNNVKDSGWVGMRSVADLRREANIGAPRNSDSLYKPIERKKRVFNPLRVPTSLQAALPFKTKPKLEAKRKRKSLEQRRAVVVEPEERKAMSLVAQLNAIRNAKAVARRDQKARHAVKQAKAAVAEEEWKAAYNKEERKKRFVEKGHAEKKKAKRAKGD
jgi:ribosome biogenesis protein BMS1